MILRHAPPLLANSKLRLVTTLEWNAPNLYGGACSVWTWYILLGSPLRVIHIVGRHLRVSDVPHHTAEDDVVKRCALDVAVDAPWTPQNKLSKTWWVNYPMRFAILSRDPKVKACLPTATRLGASPRIVYGIESPMLRSETNMLSESEVCEVRFLAWDTALWFCSTHDLSEEAGSLPDMASASPSIVTNISTQKHQRHRWIASQTLEMGSIGPKCTLKDVFNSRNQAQHWPSVPCQFKNFELILSEKNMQCGTKWDAMTECCSRRCVFKKPQSPKSDGGPPSGEVGTYESKKR